jgi:cell division protein FtsL
MYVKRRLELLGLDVLMALAAINIWTGAPLFAVWVGSRVVESSRPTMGAVFLIVVVLAVLAVALMYVLSVASAAHDRLSGRKPTVRRQVPWLRSMRAERVQDERERRELTALERLLVITVVAAVLVFEVWFFFFSGSPIGH